MSHLPSGLAHRPGWLFIAILSLLPALLFAQGSQDFSVVLLPDTQYYSESFPDLFKQQTSWIVANRSLWNIRFVIGEGDIVNTPGQTYEWINADEAINTLEAAGIPYALAIGNHDYDGIAPSKRGTIAYNQWFGVKRYAPFAWYGGHLGTTNENFYATFSVNGQRYLVIALEYYPRDQAISWADSLMNANPGAKIFVVTHSFIFTDGTRGDLCDTADMRHTTGRNAETVWETMLKKHTNLQLVVSGHLTAATSAHRTDLGTQGNVVNQIFTNFQSWSKGGTGYLRILKFRPSLNRIEVYTYSTYLKKFLTSSTYQFTIPIANAGNTAQTGALEGKVRTPGCAIVANAEVRAGGITVTTDSKGRFKIPNLAAPVAYTASVTASGYSPQSKTTTVYAGYTTQLDFYLTTSSAGSGVGTSGITMTSPVDGSTVSNPVAVKATAASSLAIRYIQLYFDGMKTNQVSGDTMSLSVTLSSGAHRVTAKAKDANGVLYKQTANITVK